VITTKKDTKEKPVQQEENKPHTRETHNHENNHRKKPFEESNEEEPIPHGIQEPFPSPDQDYRPHRRLPPQLQTIAGVSDTGQFAVNKKESQPLYLQL
jgi:hypothetical protein